MIAPMRSKVRGTDGAIADYVDVKAIDLQPEAEVNIIAAMQRKPKEQGWRNCGLTKAIELKPDDASAYNNRGILRRSKGDLDGAIADFTKSIELKPDDANAYHGRSLAKKAKGDSGRRNCGLTKAIELKNRMMRVFTLLAALQRQAKEIWTALSSTLPKPSNLNRIKRMPISTAAVQREPNAT